mgnify:CR=1 FL=1
MDRIFLGGVVVSLVVSLRMVFFADENVSVLVSYVAVMGFLLIGSRYALRYAPTPIHHDGIE